MPADSEYKSVERGTMRHYRAMVAIVLGPMWIYSCWVNVDGSYSTSRRVMCDTLPYFGLTDGGSDADYDG